MISIELVSHEISFQLLFYIYFRFCCMSREGEIFPPLLSTFLFRQTIWIHDTEFAIDLSPVPDSHGPFLRSLEGGQI